jgi:predicted TPR repeat methyltransferase
MKKNALQQALELHQTGQLEQAQQLYHQILAAEPERADVLHLLGILHAQQGELATALHYLQRAIQYDPHQATVYNNLGNVYQKLKNWPEAQQTYKKALQLNPNYAIAHNNLGVVYQQQDDPLHAQQQYEKALQLKDDYADAHYNLGSLLIKQQHPKAALPHLQKTLQLQPEHAEALGHVAQILQQQHKIPEAIEYYQKRLQLEPQHAETHYQLGTALFQQQRLDEAIHHWQETLRLQPKHLEALHNLGAAYLQHKHLHEALKCYLQLLQQQPTAENYFNVGVVFMDLDRHNDAIQYFTSALRLKPEDFATLQNLATTYLKKGDYSQAAQYYRQALALQPDNPETLYLLAALENQPPPKAAPTEYLQHLFDQYAPHFEQHLLTHLDYRVPQLLYDAVIQEVKTTQQNWQILDVGCGTGLAGVKFRPLAKRLLGIDISEKMLAMAREKNVYDELLQGDLQQLLPNFSQLDLILAADVFTYIGKLTEVFKLSYAALNLDGWLAFTVEKTTTYPYVLQKSARYAHDITYIETLAQEAGPFIICHAEEAVLRREKKQPVEGYVVVLRKV